MSKHEQLRRIEKVMGGVHNSINKFERLLQKKATDEEYIHSIRVYIKHLRGWLRLLRIDKHKICWKTMDRRLRDLSGSLGQARDHQVIAECLELFAKDAKTEAERQVLQRLQTACSEKKHAANIDWPHFKHELSVQLAIYRNHYTKSPSLKSLRHGLSRQYEKTVATGQHAYSDVDDIHALHQFRKNVKALTYQLSYIFKGFNKLTKKRLRKLDELGDLLGKTHDLDMVRKYLHNLSGNELRQTERHMAEQLIDCNLQSLQEKSVEIYDDIFEQDAKDFIKFIY